MKKLIVFSVLFILAAGAAFAQLANGIWVNAWGRGVFVPLWYESGDMQFGEAKPNSEPIFINGTGVTWDPNDAPRVDFRVNGGTDHVGFMIHVNSEFKEGTGNGDNGAQLWVKPFGNNLLKLTVANHFIEDTLRGRVTTDTGFENFVLGKSMQKYPNGIEPLNQDVIFNRFGGGRGSLSLANAANTSTHLSAALPNVFFISSSPIEGLFLGMMLQGILPSTELKETWRQVHAGAGYEIPDIGFARAQYIGGYMGKEKDSSDLFQLDEPSKFELAFALTAIDDLTLDLGFKIWMPVTRVLKNTTSYRGLDIALGAAWQYGDFNLACMAQALYLGAYTGSRAHNDDSSKGADGMHLSFNLIPEYNFDFGTLGLSFILQTKLANTDADGKTVETGSGSPWTGIGAGVFYKKGLAGGSLKTGVTFTLPPIGTGYYTVQKPDGTGGPSDNTRTGPNGRYIITIPIILEYAFF